MVSKARDREYEPTDGDRERFAVHVDRSGGPDSCWRWTASINGRGYGQFALGGGMITAHRFAWEQANGPLGRGLVLRHQCHNKACTNPRHLLTGSQSDNLRDSVRDGLLRRKLEPSTALPRIFAMRAAGKKPRQIAEVMGVGRRLIARILSGEVWGAFDWRTAQKADGGAQSETKTEGGARARLLALKAKRAA